MKNNSKTIWIMLCLVMVICACTNRKADQLYPAPVTCIADTIGTVSFSKHIVPILTKNCATPGCHTGSAPQSNLSLDSSVAYTKLSKPGSGYIDTLQPKNSLLYAQLVSISIPMPPTGKLDDCTIRLVLKWIEQKGRNN